MTANSAKKLSSGIAFVGFAMVLLFAHLLEKEKPEAITPDRPAPAPTPSWAKSVSGPDVLASQEEVTNAALPACSNALSQQVELAQLAVAHHLELTARQLVLFASITRAVQSERRRYEADIATILPGAGSHFNVVIPMYPLIGDKLRALYYRQLDQDLGPEKASEIRATLGADVENLFADFGAAEQGFEVCRQKGAAGMEYVVNTTSVLRWNLSDQGYAIHRETHLLPTEDPTGADWGGFVRLFADHSET